MARHQIIDVRCDHCNARPSKPCRSVGDRVIVEPHMKRIEKALGKGWGEGVDENLQLKARETYAEAAVRFVFGRVSSNLLAAAKKDRSIDARKKWVRDAFAGNVMAGTGHREFHPKYSSEGARGAASCVQLELIGLEAIG